MKEADSKLKFVTNSAAQVYIPSPIILDSSFPLLREDQDVKVKIVGERIVIEKSE